MIYRVDFEADTFPVKREGSITTHISGKGWLEYDFDGMYGTCEIHDGEFEWVYHNSETEEITREETGQFLSKDVQAACELLAKAAADELEKDEWIPDSITLYFEDGLDLVPELNSL